MMSRLTKSPSIEKQQEDSTKPRKAGVAIPVKRNKRHWQCEHHAQNNLPYPYEGIVVHPTTSYPTIYRHAQIGGWVSVTLDEVHR